MRESTIAKNCLLATSKLGARLFRNNVGMATTDTGGVVKYGLCAGSADYIGWMPVTVTPEMVGRTLAVFTAMEVKATGGLVSECQRVFLSRVQDAGGIGFVARSPEAAQECLLSWPALWGNYDDAENEEFAATKLKEFNQKDTARG
jgi:hypothetical protein